jgi:uncharacterized delta-60 repeat protein
MRILPALALCVLFAACSTEEVSGGSFELKLPDRLTVDRGRTAHLQVEFLREKGFTDVVEVSFASLPEGVTAPAVSSREGGLAVLLEINAGGAARPGTVATVELRASGGGVTRTGSVELILEDPGGLLDDSLGEEGAFVVENVPGMRATCGLGVDAQGSAFILQMHDGDYVLEKRDTQAALDSRFGDGGRVRLGLGTDYPKVSCGLAVLGDGSVLVAGTAGRFLTPMDVFVAHIGVDGRLDTGFGTAGIARVSFEDDVEMFELLTDLDVASDGRIFITVMQQYGRFAFARLTPAGALDTGFGAQGFVRGARTGDEQASVHGELRLALQPDGKLLLGSTWQRTPDPTDQWRLDVRRFLADGALDLQFGEQGRRTVATGTTERPGSIFSLAPRPDGRILVTARARFVPEGPVIHLIQLQADGTLDSTFGVQGMRTLPAEPHSLIGMHARPMQDGRIWAPGAFQLAGRSQLALWRFTPEALPDMTFHGGQPVSTDWEYPAGSEGLSLVEFGDAAVLPDGRWLLLGEMAKGMERGMMLARFWP